MPGRAPLTRTAPLHDPAGRPAFRVFDPSPGPPAPAAAGPPTPLDEVVISRSGRVLRRWAPGDAARCTLCPGGCCVYISARDGQGICVTQTGDSPGL